MTTRQRRNSRRRKLLLPLGAVAVMAYFGYHSFNGDYGIWSRDRMNREAIGLEAELQSLKAQRLALQERSRLLRPESLDPDMIDERARSNLNVLKPDELVIDLAASQSVASQ
ncbi:septum formation initiator family protein [Kaistia geumhonensis]|uniref:Cell division protein FtsB n=1 Tax=Kaistia geumhonensis TaxID=410839 RepID=A0ABU0M167_9HYPH|nr:septum formation initiator family protein [Kaistia geumhonensis]MCX5480080.1 septum formation initiator family protein [Kaistia geumhonensis]MDQ0514692.1 cell division protein FtsB [Kaistia geumhonensis]